MELVSKLSKVYGDTAKLFNDSGSVIKYYIPPEMVSKTLYLKSGETVNPLDGGWVGCKVIGYWLKS